MKTSYNWLQTYFTEKLPPPKELAELLTMRVFEVEGVEDRGDDVVLEIKVLPDRAHYCLSHRGIAGEIAAVLGRKRNDSPQPITALSGSVTAAKISISEPERCARYIGRRIEGVSVEDSPEWLIKRLESIGQRSINAIVDAANYVMFDMGQPLHAFDADKLVGGITVRLAKEGGKITTLDGKDLLLQADTLVIADDAGPLAIAGIKGGTRAQVDSNTKNIIVESANFAAGQIRKTSTVLGIRTDASKRFENGITPEYAARAIEEVTALILSLSPSAAASACTDVYPAVQQQTPLSISAGQINQTLGVEIPREEIRRILESIGIRVDEEKDTMHLTIPPERLDLTIPEDIVEEVGRLWGYEKIEGRLPPQGNALVKNKRQYYMEKVRDMLTGMGFSEVYLYSLVESGFHEIALPLAEDKKALRVTLEPGVSKALFLNSRNAPLLGLNQIKIFEFGTVFPETGEALALAVGVSNAPGYTASKPEEETQKTVEHLLTALGAPAETIPSFNVQKNIIEWSFDEFIKHLPDPIEALVYETKRDVRYQPFSPYPFVLRDIAVWMPEENTGVELIEVIRQEAGDLLVTSRLFDEYKKDGRTSYAFRLVFQSMKRTLTDEEVNEIMEQISKAVEGQGWEVR